jgi:hypothetical protein
MFEEEAMSYFEVADYPNRPIYLDKLRATANRIRITVLHNVTLVEVQGMWLR